MFFSLRNGDIKWTRIGSDSIIDICIPIVLLIDPILTSSPHKYKVFRLRTNISYTTSSILSC